MSSPEGLDAGVTGPSQEAEHPHLTKEEKIEELQSEIKSLEADASICPGEFVFGAILGARQEIRKLKQPKQLPVYW